MQIGSSSRSSLETPFNWILSNESSVRILRELFLSSSPLSKSEIAHRAGISLAGVVKALPRLFDTGIVMPVSTGTRQAVAVRDAHPLKGTLEILYTTEALQKQQLTTELTRLISGSRLDIRSAWLDESTRTGPSAPVTIGVLTSSAEVRPVQDALRPEIAQLAEKFGVTLELSVRTMPDIVALSPVERERLGGVTPLYGPDPLLLATGAAKEPASPRPGTTHADRETQSLHRAMWIVRLLDRDPGLPGRARSWVVHRLHTAHARESADLRDWLYLLDSAPIPSIQYVLLRVDERSDRLRQTNPFIKALSSEERRRMIAETSA
ncbi:hypothetical protein SAMN05216486_10199 [bacterium JGI 053]|nr:hypothetical protein SAMN05216486_10199 [bacterium JGI 053]